MIRWIRILSVVAYLLLNLSACESGTDYLSASETGSPNGRTSRLVSLLTDDGWDVSRLDTARNVTFLTSAEKDVILGSNAVRTDPARFAELYVKPIAGKFDGNLMMVSGGILLETEEGVDAVNELFTQLIRTTATNVQNPSEGMSRAASDHARDQSKSGSTGHTGGDGAGPFERMNRYGTWEGSAGENISYGYGDGMDIVLQLLIDDGVPSRGHRANILDPIFTVIGVGIDGHSVYGNVCVIDYAAGYLEK